MKTRITNELKALESVTQLAAEETNPTARKTAEDALYEIMTITFKLLTMDDKFTADLTNFINNRLMVEVIKTIPDLLKQNIEEQKFEDHINLEAQTRERQIPILFDLTREDIYEIKQQEQKCTIAIKEIISEFIETISESKPSDGVIQKTARYCVAGAMTQILHFINEQHDVTQFTDTWDERWGAWMAAMESINGVVLYRKEEDIRVRDGRQALKDLAKGMDGGKKRSSKKRKRKSKKRKSKKRKSKKRRSKKRRYL